MYISRLLRQDTGKRVLETLACAHVPFAPRPTPTVVVPGAVWGVTTGCTSSSVGGPAWTPTANVPIVSQSGASGPLACESVASGPLACESDVSETSKYQKYKTQPRNYGCVT